MQALIKEAEEGLAQRDGQIAALQVRHSLNSSRVLSVFLLQGQLEAAHSAVGSHQQQDSQKTANLQQQLGMTICEVARLRQVASASAAVVQTQLDSIQQRLIRVTCYVLRVTCCVLRVTCYVLRVACYVMQPTLDYVAAGAGACVPRARDCQEFRCVCVCCCACVCT